MRFSTAAAALLAVFVSVTSAGMVITPIDADQVVDSVPGDCYFGVSTPQGCGPLRKTMAELEAERAAQAAGSALGP